MASPIYGTSFLAIQPDLKGFGASLTRGLGGTLAQAGKESGDSFGVSLIKAVTAIGIGRVIVGQITSSIDESLKFESAFAGVVKTVDGTVAQLDNLRSGIIDMAKVLPAAREEIAGIAEAAGQLGVQTENILDFTKVMIDLGETTDLTADQAATAFAQIANIMKTPQTAFENMASTLVDLGNKGASTESQIVDFALRIAGAGEIAGLAESQVFGIGSAMASVGVEAEAGGTAVQKVLLSITEAVSTGNDNLKIFAETAGLSASQFAKAWEEDAGQAFTLFVEGLGNAGTDAFRILDELELTDQRLIRSFLSLAGAGDLLRQSLDTGNRAWDENSAAAEEANKRYETSAARLEVVKNRATELQRQMGDELVPIIVSLAEQHIPSLENAFEDLTTSIPGEADFLDLVNFLGDLPKGFGQVGDGIKTSFATFSGAVEGFSSVLTLGLVGDTEAGLNRITDAWEDLAQNTVFRTATQSMVENLRAGEEPALAFANALALVGRRGKIDPKVIRTLSQIADVDPSQLVAELQGLVDLGPELGLSAEDIDAVRIALIDLGPPSIEAVRHMNEMNRAGSGAADGLEDIEGASSGAIRATSDTVEVMLALRDAADEAGVSVGEFVLDGSDVARTLLETLDPADQLSVKIGAIRNESDLAAATFINSFTPALVDAGSALRDLNNDGKVTLNEFIEESRELGTAVLNFVDNLNLIEDVSPELAAKLSAVPIETGALLVQQVADDLSRVPEVLDALNLPGPLGNTINGIVLEALQIARREGFDSAELEDFINFVNLLPLKDEIKDDILGRISAGLEAAKDDVGNLIEDTFAQEDAFNRAAGIGADVYDREIIRRVGSSAFATGGDIGDMIAKAFTEEHKTKPAAERTSDAYSRSLINAVAADRLGIEGDIGDTIAAYFALDLSAQGAAARASFITGLSHIKQQEAFKIRDSIVTTVNNATNAHSPPQLFIDFGVEAGKAYWSGFESQGADSFGAGEKMLGKLRNVSASVSVAGGVGGGINIDRFEVNNPIGEPTEDTVQSALLEVAVNPFVNRLVSAGSSR